MLYSRIRCGLSVLHFPGDAEHVSNSPSLVFGYLEAPKIAQPEVK